MKHTITDNAGERIEVVTDGEGFAIVQTQNKSELREVEEAFGELISWLDRIKYTLEDKNSSRALAIAGIDNIQKFVRYKHRLTENLAPILPKTIILNKREVMKLYQIIQDFIEEEK